MFRSLNLLVMLLMLFLSVVWRRDRDAYLRQSERLAIARGVSAAYAQGFTALGWLVYLGFLLQLGLGVWVDVFDGSYRGKLPLFFVSQALIWAGLLLPFAYWPRWAMPPHARADLSPMHHWVARRSQPRPQSPGDS